MIVLGIDTSTRFSSVAIVQDDQTLVSLEGSGDKHGADLLVLIDQACKEAGVAPDKLDAVAVGAGPGSFTGLRIGMATAKGIAFAAKCPLWSVSSLAALAHDELVKRPLALMFAILDARKGEVFAGAYRRDDDRTTLIGEERAVSPKKLIPPAGSRVIGDYFESFIGHDVIFPASPTGAAVARLALEGARVDVTVAGGPTYIRPAEAEVKYPDGVPGAQKRR